MINKKNLWFLTLFSLILVLSVYYITMPTELLITNNSNFVTKEVEEKKENEPVINIEESEILTAMRVERDEELLKKLDALKLIMTDKDATVEEKNNAFDSMKKLNINKALEKELEQKVQDTYNLKSFIKIDGNQIKVVIDSNEHNTKLANDIMRLIQENFEDKKYISVQFKS